MQDASLTVSAASQRGKETELFLHTCQWQDLIRSLSCYRFGLSLCLNPGNVWQRLRMYRWNLMSSLNLKDPLARPEIKLLLLLLQIATVIKNSWAFVSTLEVRDEGKQSIECVVL